MRATGYSNRARSCLRRMRTGIRPPARSRGGTIVTIENIVVTESDYARLHSLIESSRRLRQRDTERLDELENELNRAGIVKPSEVSSNVVTMNSRVRIKDLRSGRKLTYQIVFPKDADISERPDLSACANWNGVTGISSRHNCRVAGTFRNAASPNPGCGISTRGGQDGCLAAEFIRK